MSIFSTSQSSEHNPKPTVLLIDTNLIVAEATCMVLRNNNYNCVIVSKVDEILEQDMFDVIVSALHIEHDFDAVDLIKQLQTHHPCPLIFVTGESPHRAIQHMQGLNPVAIISKPYDDNTLLSTLAAATSEPSNTPQQRPSRQ